MNETLVVPVYSDYKICHTFNSLLTDDTGNTWTKVGNPSINNNRLYTSRSNYIYIPISIQNDFTFEYYNIYKSESGYYGFCPPCLCLNDHACGTASQRASIGLYYLSSHGGLGLVIMMDDGTKLCNYNTRVIPLNSNRNHYKYERIGTTFNFYYNGSLIRSYTSSKIFRPMYLSTDCGGSGYTEDLKFNC